MNAMQGVEHALRGIAALPDATKKGLIYLIVGHRADCGQQCVDHHAIIEQLANELGLNNQVLFIDEHLSQARGSHTIHAMNAVLGSHCNYVHLAGGIGDGAASRGRLSSDLPRRPLSAPCNILRGHGAWLCPACNAFYGCPELYAG